MSEPNLSKKINGILNEVSKLSRTLCAMNNIDSQQYLENYEMLSTDAALRSELITCKLRQLIYGGTTINKPEYLISAATVQGIEISENNGVLDITLPCLLPKRKKHSMEFLADPLYFALGQYADSHTLPKYSHCVVCFSHVYNQMMSLRRVRDYDNLQIKQLLDVIAAYIMEDDSGLLCDAYNTTELGETDCTRISIMSKDRFPGWIKERENRLKSISDF